MVNNKMWEQLGLAIVERAMIDYEKALITQHKTRSATRNLKALYVINDCERFFRGKDCSLYLSNFKGLDGETIMKRSKENVIACKYNWKKLKRLHSKLRTPTNRVC